jgi:hypothetical protein
MVLFNPTFSRVILGKLLQAQETRIVAMEAAPPATIGTGILQAYNLRNSSQYPLQS